MTEDKAKEKVKVLNGSYSTLGYCPLKNGDCTKSCVCYRKAYVIYDHDGKGGCAVQKPFCGNKMLQSF